MPATRDGAGLAFSKTNVCSARRADEVVCSKSGVCPIEVAEKSVPCMIMKTDHEIEDDKKPDHT